MPDLKNMARTKADIKAEKAEWSKPDDTHVDKYPWGLEIRLDNESLEKLNVEKLEVGSSMMLTAEVKVESMSVNDKAKGKSKKSCTLQITAMALSEKEKEGPSAADTLYGKGD